MRSRKNHQSSKFVLPTYRSAGISLLGAATEHDRPIPRTVKAQLVISDTNDAQWTQEICEQSFKIPHDFSKRTSPSFSPYPINLSLMNGAALFRIAAPPCFPAANGRLEKILSKQGQTVIWIKPVMQW